MSKFIIDTIVGPAEVTNVKMVRTKEMFRHHEFDLIVTFRWCNGDEAQLTDLKVRSNNVYMYEEASREEDQTETIWAKYGFRISERVQDFIEAI